MPLHKLPLIKDLMCKKMPFSDTNFEKSPYRGRGKPPPTPSPRSVALLPRFGPPLTNPGCTTVTGIAKGTKGHAPAPLDWSKIIFQKKGGVGDWYMSLHITNPLIMPFNVQEMSFSYTNFQKISLPHPPPSRSLRSLTLAPVDTSWLHHCYWNS